MVTLIVHIGPLKGEPYECICLSKKGPSCFRLTYPSMHCIGLTHHSMLCSFFFVLWIWIISHEWYFTSCCLLTYCLFAWWMIKRVKKFYRLALAISSDQNITGCVSISSLAPEVMNQYTLAHYTLGQNSLFSKRLLRAMMCIELARMMYVSCFRIFVKGT